jgi:hypothetical protein
MVTLTVLILAGCNETTPKQESILLPPAEVFTWTGDQPISFSPPPAEWNRSRYQNGGTEGVDFVLSGSGGEQILIAERFFLGNRDRCLAIRELQDNLSEFNARSFSEALQKGKRYKESALSVQDEKITPVINDTLDRAKDQFRAGDMALLQVELTRALELSGEIRYTLAETVDQVLFTATGNSVYPKLQVDAPVDDSLAGEPAVRVNFTFDSHGVPFVGRRIYVIHNNRMFEIGFQGRESTLPLFEAVLDSITFPAGPCEH